MAKRKVSSSKKVSGEKSLSPVMQFAVAFIILAAIALAYYVGTMR